MTERVIRITIDPATQTGAAKVESDLKRINEAAKSSRASVRGLQTGVESFGATGSTSLQGVASKASGLGSVFKGLVGGASFTVLAREILAYAKAVAGLVDEYSKIQNQLRLVTTGSENLARVQSELFDIAQETRSPLEATSLLYARIARNAADLGLSQKQLLDVTKTVNQAIQVSGGTAAEASAGVVQFSQALASGVLRGDELKSIMENMPRLSQALADGLGVGIGELRALGEAGELTSDKVIKALQKSAPAVAAEFAKITPTIGGAFTTLRNSLVDMIGKLNESSGVGKDFAQLIINASTAITDFGKAISGTLQPTDELSSGMQVFVTIVLTLYSVLEALVTLITGVVFTAFKTVGDAMGGIGAAAIALLQGDFKQAALIAQDTINGIGENIKTGFIETADELVADMSKRIEALVELWNKGARDAAPAQAQLASAPGKKKKEDTVTSVIDEIRANDPFANFERDTPNALPTEVAGFGDLVKETTEQAEKDLDKFGTEEFRRIKFKMKEFSEESSEFAKEAARNIQDGFAEFLFDPFKGGLDGMLQGFINTMRKIAAEALAAKAMQALSGLLSNSGNPYLAAAGAILGGRAEGGSVQKGVPYTVNERRYQKRRSEVFIPNQAGRIVDQSSMPAAPAQEAPFFAFVRDENELANALATHGPTKRAMVQFITAHRGEIKTVLG